MLILKLPKIVKKNPLLSVILVAIIILELFTNPKWWNVTKNVIRLLICLPLMKVNNTTKNPILWLLVISELNRFWKKSKKIRIKDNPKKELKKKKKKPKKLLKKQKKQLKKLLLKEKKIKLKNFKWKNLPKKIWEEEDLEEEDSDFINIDYYYN